MKLSSVSQVRSAIVFRSAPPQESEEGNVLALAIRDLATNKQIFWNQLPRVQIDDFYLSHCLQPGDVVIPARGDYYKAHLFQGATEAVFPLGQLHVITAGPDLDARFLVWYLNLKATQSKINSVLTGTSIKALNKTSLLNLEVEVPLLPKQLHIADLVQTTDEIVAIRDRLNRQDEAETTQSALDFLRKESRNVP